MHYMYLVGNYGKILKVSLFSFSVVLEQKNKTTKCNNISTICNSEWMIYKIEMDKKFWIISSEELKYFFFFLIFFFLFAGTIEFS